MKKVVLPNLRNSRSNEKKIELCIKELIVLSVIKDYNLGLYDVKLVKYVVIIF